MPGITEVPPHPRPRRPRARHRHKHLTCFWALSPFTDLRGTTLIPMMQMGTGGPENWEIPPHCRLHGRSGAESGLKPWVWPWPVQRNSALTGDLHGGVSRAEKGKSCLT